MNSHSVNTNTHRPSVIRRLLITGCLAVSSFAAVESVAPAVHADCATTNSFFLSYSGYFYGQFRGTNGVVFNGPWEYKSGPTGFWYWNGSRWVPEMLPYTPPTLITGNWIVYYPSNYRVNKVTCVVG